MKYFNSITTKSSVRLIIVIVLFVCCKAAVFAYDFEKDGLYYNILSETTVECCGGGQSPNDATYRKTEVIIPSTVTRGLKTYTVVKIADYAWGQVQYLVWIKKLILPNTIKEIGVGAFRDANNIETINLPEGLKSIGDYAMQGPRLTEIIFPKSLESIGTRAFNSKLKTVIFTSATAPSFVEETFAYQNGGIYDIFIPAGFNMYVPNLQSYSHVSYYEQYMTPIVTFSENRFIYSGTSPNLNYNITLPNDHTISLDTTLLPINAGSHSVTLNGKIDNEISIEIPINIVIDKADLRIIADDVNREYGDSNPTFTAKIYGLQNNEDINEALTDGFNLYTDATLLSDINQYQILLSSDKSINYKINYHPGTLNIVKAPITLSVMSHTREYGIDNPQFQLIIDGLKNDEQTPKWDKAPIFSTIASKTSEIGCYPITVLCEPHNYEVVSVENGILTITKAHLVLTANSYEKEYYSENPIFTFDLLGLRNDDDENCLTKQPTFSCGASLNSDCGIYSISPSDADATNYEISYKDGTLVVMPADLLLLASNISREYGDPNPVLRYDAIGLKGEDQLITSLNNEPILATTATEYSNAGEYPITISGASSKNYEISYRQGMLTVDKAPLMVIAADAERVYGDNNPSFSRTYLGFKLNDTETSAFSTLPRLTCSATKSSDAGEYSIAVEGGISRNYEVSVYQNGILTVTKAPIVLTANDKSRLYYESNPQFDFTLSGLKNNDTKLCLTTLPTYTCTAELTSNTGQYQIIPSNAEARNYTFEYRDGTLSVGPRSLTASVGNYTRKYDTENPLFEVSYSGFVNDEDSSVMLRQSTVSCEATKTSDVGSYTLTPTGGEAINYNVTKYNNGTLTIEKADQTLSWDQDLSNINLYSQIALTASSDAGLPVSYEMSPNNVANLYDNAGVWYLDCYGSGAVSIRAVQKGNGNYNATSMITKTLVVNGSGGDPSNPQIYLHVESAGTLPAMIADNRKHQIKNLRLTGYLNGTDINFLREMAGSDSYGNSTPGILESLDISGCTIVSGGRSYYHSYQTSNYKVGDYMFYSCKVLVNLQLPNNSTSLGLYALADCDRLSNLSIPNSITSFGSYTFRNDISLLRIPMPNNLTTIGDMAFYGCKGLTELTIPKNVNYLGDGILNACENISKINVEDGNSYFASQDGVLYTVNFDKLLIFPVCHDSNIYTVLEGVSKIASYAFVDSKKLNEVTLPSSLSSIGKDAFIGCANLTSLRVKALNPPICENDCFDTVSKTRCELLVPNGCYSYYWVAPVWSEFNKISESDFYSGIDGILDKAIDLIVENRNIIIKGVPAGVQMQIYKTDGTLIYSTTSIGCDANYQPSTSGIYIISISGQAYKIVIR